MKIKYKYNLFLTITFVRNMQKVNVDSEYFSLVQNVLTNGTRRQNRTNIPTISIFGTQNRYNIKDNALPLLTTKKMPFKMIVKELLWFISGSTNANVLKNQNVHIWDANGSREFLDSRGLTNNKEGDLGPVYGFQWRHYSATYVGMEHDYTGEGIDQLETCIRMIQEDPFSRRIIMTAWNVSHLDQMALPPCHMTCQFYVTENTDGNKNYLSCQLYQRSGDIGLGVPFNICSYAILTKMIAHVCNLEALELIHTIGDAHIYEPHVSCLEEQLTRQSFDMPTLTFERDIESIDDFVLDDFVLCDYQCHEAIRMQMAV
jgi:thymidylate synthase